MGIRLLFLIFWISKINITVGAESLCEVDGCQCTGVSIHCYCHHQQVLKVGMEDRVKDASQPPAETMSLHLENCHHVELYGGLLNHMENLQNLTVKQCHTVVIHPKLFEARGAKKGSKSVQNIELHNIQKLKVKRYSFKDIRVDGVFYLGEVVMESVVSMAFHLKFERISMFGIKIDQCGEFNILAMTQFTSLAAHAIKATCDKFSLAYNWFGQLHDSSFDVEFGLCDIQGNTFNSLQGKPFLSLTPYFPMDPTKAKLPMMGLVFRENKFIAQPTLPWASLALPSFTNLSPSDSYVDVDSNQFVCDCQTIGWLLAFGKLNYNSVSLSNVGRLESRASSFTKEMFMTAGPCLQCNGQQCANTGQTMRSFADEAISLDDSGVATCHGLALKNYDIEISKEHASVGRREKLVNRDYEADERISGTSSASCNVDSLQCLLLILSILIL